MVLVENHPEFRGATILLEKSMVAIPHSLLTTPDLVLTSANIIEATIFTIQY